MISLKGEHVCSRPRIRLNQNSRVKELVGFLPDIAIGESVSLLEVLISVHLQALIRILLDLKPSFRQRKLRICTICKFVRVRGSVDTVFIVVGTADKHLLGLRVYFSFKSCVELGFQIH